MLRIAVLEKEQCAKDIVFEFAKICRESEWTFAHYTKISDFAKADTKVNFDILILNEVFHTPRVSASFIEHHPKRIVIYCMEHAVSELVQDDMRGRILFIDRRQIKQEMRRIEGHLYNLLRAHKEYLLSYNNILVPLQLQDIYFIEKNEKNLIYHSARGLFRERKTMMQAEQYFSAYDFIRIHASFLVNVLHIAKVMPDMVVLDTKEELPIARARKKYVVDWFHSYVNKH